jgi:hypothetical protein
VKRIPPSASATAIFAAQYICTFMPGGISFSRARGWNAAGRGNNAQGGMRYALRAKSRADTWVRPYREIAVCRLFRIKAHQPLITASEKKGQGLVTPARVAHRSARRQLLLP